jgi:hypothetical protein
MNMEVTELNIDEITVDRQYQSRESVILDKDLVAEYAKLMREAKGPPSYPPVKVVLVESSYCYLLVSGFHRLAAAEKIGQLRVLAEIITPDPGETPEDRATLEAAKANREHGKQRTPGDKRRAVEMLLQHPAWRDKSDRLIAQELLVSRELVRLVKKETEQVTTVVTCDQPAKVVGKDGKKYPAKGKSKPKASGKQKPEKPSKQAHELPSEIEDAPGAEVDAGAPADASGETITMGDGNPAPPHLAASFANAHKLDELVAGLKAMKKLASEIGEDSTISKFFDESAVKGAISEAIREAEWAKPYTACPACAGKTAEADCKRCKGAGYLPMSILERHKNITEGKPAKPDELVDSVTEETEEEDSKALAMA